MAWQRRDPSPYRDCVVCGEQFVREERGYSAITCSDDCAAVRMKQTLKAWAKAHPEKVREAVASYRDRDREAYRARARGYSRRRRAAVALSRKGNPPTRVEGGN
jgi:hypothetical protein